MVGFYTVVLFIDMLIPFHKSIFDKEKSVSLLGIFVGPKKNRLLKHYLVIMMSSASGSTCMVDAVEI